MKILSLLLLSCSPLYSMELVKRTPWELVKQEKVNEIPELERTERNFEYMLIRINLSRINGIQYQVKKIIEKNSDQFDNAATKILFLAKKEIDSGDSDETERCLRIIFDKLFENFCDTKNIFQVQRMSIFASNITKLSKAMIRGYVAQHCFEQSDQPKESRENRMKVVLRYPHLSFCQEYEKLGMTSTQENNNLKTVYPNIRPVEEHIPE